MENQGREHEQEREPSLREEAESILSNTIDNRNIIERMSKERIKDTCNLIKIETRSMADENGNPYDSVEATVPVYDCGHASQGRRNFGGRDRSGYTGCNRCIKHCSRCLRSVCLGKTARIVQEKLYCRKCAFFQRIWIVLKWIFGRKRKDNNLNETVAREVNRQINELVSRGAKTNEE